MYYLWEASNVANYLKLWALFAVPYSPSERTGRSPSSVVCCFSAFYINILFNLHQTCAGPTLFEVGMLLYSAYIYPFLLTTLHLFDPFRFNSIVKPLGMKKGGGSLCSHLFMLWILLHRFLMWWFSAAGVWSQTGDAHSSMAPDLTLGMLLPMGPRITLFQVVYLGLLHVAWLLLQFLFHVSSVSPACRKRRLNGAVCDELFLPYDTFIRSNLTYLF